MQSRLFSQRWYERQIAGAGPSDGTYGYRRIAEQLARQGTVAGPELVRKLMRRLGLVSCQPRPWRAPGL